MQRKGTLLGIFMQISAFENLSYIQFYRNTLFGLKELRWRWVAPRKVLIYFQFIFWGAFVQQNIEKWSIFEVSVKRAFSKAY